jgi:hypothetical protein
MLFNATFNNISVISWRRNKKKNKQTYKQKQKNTIPVEKPGNETQWLALIRCNSTPQVYIYYRQLALSVEQ